MSAIITIRQPGCVHVLSDGAHFDGRGAVIAMRSKIYELPCCNAIVTGRGPAGAWKELIYLQLASAQSFDEALTALPDAARTAEALCAPEDGEIDQYPFEITLAGWSDTSAQMEIALLCTARTPESSTIASVAGEAYKPFALYPGPALRVAPAPQSPWEDVLGRSLTAIEDVNAIRPVSDGIAMMEAVRARQVRHWGTWFTMAAGFIELATVSRDGVERSILRRWPDEIGKRPDEVTPLLGWVKP